MAWFSVGLAKRSSRDCWCAIIFRPDALLPVTLDVKMVKNTLAVGGPLRTLLVELAAPPDLAGLRGRRGEGKRRGVRGKRRGRDETGKG